jgi:hypothetical protein
MDPALSRLIDNHTNRSWVLGSPVGHCQATIDETSSLRRFPSTVRVPRESWPRLPGGSRGCGGAPGTRPDLDQSPQQARQKDRRSPVFGSVPGSTPEQPQGMPSFRPRRAEMRNQVSSIYHFFLPPTTQADHSLQSEMVITYTRRAKRNIRGNQIHALWHRNQVVLDGDFHLIHRCGPGTITEKEGCSPPTKRVPYDTRCVNTSNRRGRCLQVTCCIRQ